MSCQRCSTFNCDAEVILSKKPAIAEKAEVGYDCGTWFVRSSAQDAVTTDDVDESGVFRRAYRVRARRVNPLWNLVKVTRRGYGASAESVSVESVEQGFKIRLL